MKRPFSQVPAISEHPFSRLKPVLAALIFLFFSATSLFAAKTATGAYLTYAVDDGMDLFINGTHIGYYNCGSSCYDSVNSVTLSAALFNVSDCNIIATTVDDCCQGASWITYKLDILYNDGSKDEIISDANNMQFYYDGLAVPGPLSLPPNVAGNNWTQFPYVPGNGWSPPQYMTPGQCNPMNDAVILDQFGVGIPDAGAACSGVSQYQTWSYRQPFASSLGVACAPTPTDTPIPITCAPGDSVIDLFPGTTFAAGSPLTAWGCCGSGGPDGLDDCSDGTFAASRNASAGWWDIANTAASGSISKVVFHILWETNGDASSGSLNLRMNYSADGSFTKKMGADQVWGNPTPWVLQQNTLSMPIGPSGGAWTWAEVNNLRLYLMSDAKKSLVSCAFFEVCYSNPSPTPTQTPTKTITSTLTASATYTGTPTRTGTPTYSATPSPTPTKTVTDTNSPSPTRTASPSPSPSSTETLTRTGTSTQTASPTLSPSSTQTGTRTETPFETATSTDTASATPSVSPSPTATASFTATASESPSRTETASSTATPSSTATASESPSRTETVTSTPTPSESPSSTETLAISDTDTPTSTESPSVTATPTESATFTASPSLSATRTESPTSTASPSITLSPTLIPTATPQPPLPPLIASVRVYNSAGELVAILNDALPVNSMPTGLSQLIPSFLPDQNGAGVLKLQGPGLSLVWDGTTTSGQIVDGGSYSVVVEIHDNFGNVQTWSQDLTVIRTDQRTDVEVYNSAGELVWHQTVSPVSPGSVRLSARELVPGADPTGLKISYGSDPTDFLNWNGTGSQGQSLSSGTYIVKVTQSGSSGKTTTSYPIAIIQANANVFAWVAAAPNPVRSGTGSVMVSLQGASAGIVAWGEVYNLAGEHVGSISAVSGGFLQWNISDSLASGVYLLRVSARDSQGRFKSALVKISLVR